MRRTISWSVSDMLRPSGCSSPLRVAVSPLTWCGGDAPLAAGGWCMSAGRAGGDSLRVRLRGGRCPAPSSPESVEARLARSAAPARRARRSAEITSAPAASASTPLPSDVTTPDTHHPHSIDHLPLFVAAKLSLLGCCVATLYRQKYFLRDCNQETCAVTKRLDRCYSL